MRILLLVGLLMIVGYGLTFEQAQALDAYEAQLEKLHETGGAFREELSHYDDEIKAVVAKMKLKQIPVEEGMALIAQFMERKTETLKAYSEIRAEIDATWQAKVDLEAKEVPWFAVAVTTITAILGALGLKKWQVASKLLKVVVCGVEDGKSKEVKNAILAKAIESGVSGELKKVVDANTPAHTVA